MAIMEVNNGFRDFLYSSAEEVLLCSIIDEVNYTGVIEALLKAGKKGKVVKCSDIDGRTLYSFMSVDEMYKILFRCSKSEYETFLSQEQKNKEIRDIRARLDKEIDSIFPEFEKLVKEAFPHDPKHADWLIFAIKKEMVNWPIKGLKDLLRLMEFFKGSKANNNTASIEIYNKLGVPENHGTRYECLGHFVYNCIYSTKELSDYIKEEGKKEGLLEGAELKYFENEYKKMNDYKKAQNGPKEKQQGE